MKLLNDGILGVVSLTRSCIRLSQFISLTYKLLQ